MMTMMSRSAETDPLIVIEQCLLSQQQQLDQYHAERDQLLDKVERLTTANIRLTLKLLDALMLVRRWVPRASWPDWMRAERGAINE